MYLWQNFNGDALLELIKQLVRMDKHWIPEEPGHSLYIRPTLSKPYTLVEVHARTDYIYSWHTKGYRRWSS